MNEDLHRHVSYGIEAEDIMIDRLLSVFWNKDTNYVGFYIDIGAFHPIQGSNTWMFYKRGWSGLNIEPNPEGARLLREVRPRDVTLNIGVADANGLLLYHNMSDPIANGFFTDEFFPQLERSGYKHINSVAVMCDRIDSILCSNVNETQIIDLLNVDVEGYENFVWRHWNWNKWRPKIIVTEIHSRSVGETAQTEQAKTLIENGYWFVSRMWHSSIFVDSAAGWP